MSKLWPGWKPNEEQGRWWRRLLGSYDSRTASAAIDAAVGENRGKEPQAHVVRDKLRELASQHTGQAREETLGETGLWAQCVEATMDHLGRLGEYRPLIFPKRSGMPDEPAIRERARQLAEHCQQLYGGRWVVVEARDQRQMEMARQKLLRPDLDDRLRAIEASCPSRFREQGRRAGAEPVPAVSDQLPF
ncbi:MAG: hypothetical protein ABIH03_17390 [Pseudomonadota bacterium]